jgi:hypothetical protein
VRAAFEATLRREIENIQVQKPLHDAAVGAALLADNG